MTRSGRVCWSRSPLPSWRSSFISILRTSRPHIKDNGSGGGRFDCLLFCCLLALGESTPGSVPSPCFPWATAIGPPEVRRRGGGGRRWGPAGGRRRGAKRPEKQGRGFASGPCFFVWQARGPLGPRAAKRRRPPRAVAVFCRPNEPSATPFLPRLPTNKTSPPLPMSGGPANSAGKPKKFSSWFSLAFFKSGRGAEPSAASGGKSEAEAQ